jgi:protein transport protein SEC24
MSTVDDYTKNQQNLLAQDVGNLSLNENNISLNHQNEYTSTTTTRPSKSTKKRVNHAFHDLSSQQNTFIDFHGDPNAAASAIGLFPPIPNFTTPNSTSTIPQQSLLQKNTGVSEFQNNFVNPLSNNILNGQQQQLQQQQQPSINNNNFDHTDLYDLNQSSIPDALSIPNLRNQMNAIYKDKTFLSFEHVLPPPAGTQYKSIDQANASPQFARTTLYSVPFSEELRDQSKIPLALILTPFAEFDVPKNEIPIEIPQIKIHQGQIVPRCSRCRAYLNPAMQHDLNTMKCNICGFVSPVPIEYSSTIDIQGTRDDYHLRPELHTGVVDYIVPKEYNLNPDDENDLKPLHRVFLIDLSHSSYKSKLVETFCLAIRMSIYKDDGSSNLPIGTKISIIGYDNCLHFYNLSSDLEQTTVSLVTDLDDPFIPFADGIFVDPIESSNIIDITLTNIEQNNRTLSPEPALSSALTAAGILLKQVGGGQIISVLSTIPSYGPGPLTVKLSAGKIEVDYIKETFTANNKFYQDSSIDFVKNNIGVNLFIASSSNVDLINLGTFATNTGGTIKTWSPFNFQRSDITLVYEIKKVIENIAGYQCQLKLRCSHGLQVNKYYGPFTTVSGQEAPNIPIVSGDTSIVTDFIYNSKLDTKKDAHFQAALLYTSKDGIRKVRVINSILSVTQRITDVFDFSDSDAITKILIKRTAEKFKSSSLVALKNSLVMQLSEIMASYKHYVSNYNTLPTQLVLPYSLRTLPMIILSILKTRAFKGRIGNSDLRIDSLFKLSQYNLTKLSSYLYPLLFCIHSLEEGDFMINEETGLMNIPNTLPMNINNLSYGGAYLAFNGDRIIIWLHNEVNPLLLQDLFGPEIDSIDKVTPYISSLPIIDTYISEQVRNMCEYLSTHYNGMKKQSIEICRFRKDPNEQEFQNMFIEDKSDDLIWSYSEFLYELHKQIDVKANGLDSTHAAMASSSSKNDDDGEKLSRKFGIF